MKILSLRMMNVRRFTTPVEVTGIGPGLNVLSAPNEHGKSTLFEALHAVFFYNVNSWKRTEAASLAPHAGGNPEIIVDFTLGQEVFRISKTFSKTASQRKVTVHRDTHLFKQGDDAEDWIRELIKAPKEGGPAGLLWVRQGLTSLPAGKEDDTRQARRDALAAVAGEIEDITGGRHMENVRARVREDLQRYLTTTGKPRTGGPLAEARARVAGLQAETEELQDKVTAFQATLDALRQLKREKSGLEDAEAVEGRRTAVQKAQAELAAAESHKQRQDKARLERDKAQLALEAHQTRLTAVETRLSDWKKARHALSEAETKVTEAQVALSADDERLQRAEAGFSDTRAALDEAEAGLELARRVLAAGQADARREELEARLKSAREDIGLIQRLRERIAKGPSAGQMAALETARADLDHLERAREASAAALTLRRAGEGETLLDGQVLTEGTRVPLPDGGEVTLPGGGSLVIHPADLGSAKDYATAVSKLDAALARTGCATLAEAREAARGCQEAQADQRDAEARLKVAAPKGIEALVGEIAGLPAMPAEGAAPLSVTEAEASRDQARRAGAEAEAALERVRKARETRHGDLRAAQGGVAAARTRFETSGAAMGDAKGAEALLRELRGALPGLDRTLADRREDLRILDDTAPDLTQVQAAATRAKSVAEQADRRLIEVGRTLSNLEGRIAETADLGIEERLTEVRGRLEKAQAHAGHVAFEVEVLELLDAELDAAQQQAHDTYIQPILSELRPLMAMVLPGAELRLDPENVLPTALSRREGEDSFEQLSGGTQEQIALLVRLAFARLVAKSGNPAPVLLDDAIVYTDDDRIERMFNALTGQAGDLQIIVLSCRQRVFQGLGGNALSIEPAQG